MNKGLNMEQRLKILKMAFASCQITPAEGEMPEQVVKAYRQFCTVITSFPADVPIDTGWAEKLDAIETHFGGGQKAADQIGCARTVFYRMKHSGEPSPTYANKVERIYTRIAGQAN